MDKPLVLNFFGGPGCRKSTTAAGVFSILKMSGFECELVTEYAKDLVWQERTKTFMDQQYIFAKQHHRLWSIGNSVDLIITDCPLLLSIVYGKAKGTGDEAFYKNILSKMNEYNNINVLLKRPGSYSRTGRNETRSEAASIDELILNELISNDIPFINTESSLTAINNIANTILNMFDLEPKYELKEI